MSRKFYIYSEDAKGRNYCETMTGERATWDASEVNMQLACLNIKGITFHAEKVR